MLRAILACSVWVASWQRRPSSCCGTFTCQAILKVGDDQHLLVTGRPSRHPFCYLQLQFPTGLCWTKAMDETAQLK